MPEVDITDIRSRDGELIVTVHSIVEGWDWDGQAAMRLHAPTANRALLRFEGLAPGSYAMQVLRDQNGTGWLDSNFLRRSLESYGASSSPEAVCRPTFDEARVGMRKGDTPIEVRLR